MIKNILSFSGIALIICILLLSTSHPRNTPHTPLPLTQSPHIPKQITFANETVDLTPIHRYEGIDRELTAFTFGHSTTLLILKRANRYFPIIDPILKANHIPEDFKYLAAIESYLNPRALSPVKAAGLWQLMPATASEYGLEISEEVDERYSVKKSTEAACKYLRKAYNQYGSWIAAAVSYNAGMGRISSELNRQQEDSALELWLVEESLRYFYRILALKTILESPLKYGFSITANTLYKPITFQSVTIHNTINDLSTFAKEHHISYAQLKEFNSWLRGRQLTVTGNKQYTIEIPTQESLFYQGATHVYDKRWIAE